MTTQTTSALTTSCTRNGTLIRVMFVDSPGSPEMKCLDEVDIHIHRILVLIAPTMEALDAQTHSLQAAASCEGITLVSADGHHGELVDRIAAANRDHR
jgi:hypothetical protein